MAESVFTIGMIKAGMPLFEGPLADLNWNSKELFAVPKYLSESDMSFMNRNNLYEGSVTSGALIHEVLRQGFDGLVNMRMVDCGITAFGKELLVEGTPLIRKSKYMTGMKSYSARKVDSDAVLYNGSVMELNAVKRERSYVIPETYKNMKTKVCFGGRYTMSQLLDGAVERYVKAIGYDGIVDKRIEVSEDRTEYVKKENKANPSFTVNGKPIVRVK